MSNLQMWALIVGFFSPLLVAVVQQRSWSDATRAIVMFILLIPIAALTVYFEKPDWNWHDFISSFLIILVTTVSTYKSLWRPTNIAPAIEAKTSPGPDTPRDV